MLSKHVSGLVVWHETLSPFFNGIDMARLIDHQTKFFITILGGPASYSDEDLGQLHHKLGIQNTHFDSIVELLQETLEDNGVDDGVVEEFAEALETRRHRIVSGAAS